MTIKGDITLIGQNAFYGCTKLSKLVMPNITKVPSLQSMNALTNVPIRTGTGYVYVPDDLVESFKTATNWSTIADKIKGVSELI
jgi:hypothetical protein